MSDNITPIIHRVARQYREKIKNQKACVLWFTGLSGSGKSTIANALEDKLNKMRYHTYLIDGDNIREGLNKDLGFSENGRKENIRRVAEVTKLFIDAGIITIVATISPFAKDRKKAKSIIGKDFFEVFTDTPLDECIKRDPKGLYKKALNKEIKNFTGVNSRYEVPSNSDIYIKTTIHSIEESVNIIIIFLKQKGYLCLQ